MAIQPSKGAVEIYAYSTIPRGVVRSLVFVRACAGLRAGCANFNQEMKGTRR